MAAEQTEAIVLRVIDFSETSVVVSLFTRAFGRISALAKGARRPKNAFDNAIDLLCVARVMLIRKPGDALALVTEAKLERRFRAGSYDLRRLYAGYYLIELLRELTDEGHAEPELFSLMVAAQWELQRHRDLSAVIARTEARILRLTGHFPLLGQCASCGRPLLLDVPHHRFALPAGGLVCSDCAPAQHGFIRLSESARRIWSDYADQESWHVPAGWDRATCGELRGITMRWISHVLGHRLRMFDEPLWQVSPPVNGS